MIIGCVTFLCGAWRQAVRRTSERTKSYQHSEKKNHAMLRSELSTPCCTALDTTHRTIHDECIDRRACICRSNGHLIEAYSLRKRASQTPNTFIFSQKNHTYSEIGINHMNVVFSKKKHCITYHLRLQSNIFCYQLQRVFVYMNVNVKCERDCNGVVQSQ